MKREIIELSPQIGDIVTVVKKVGGAPMEYPNRVRGKVADTENENGVLKLRVRYPAPWGGETSGWYLEEQLEVER
jgi:hypothetical protein